MMINYTIIIPHKNIPQLLQRCLDSIPRREDAQIIVIDDNSDADKVDFENFPGLNDPYVEVIFGKNENGRKGAGYARNLGLEKAKGKWIVFADADDFFMPCFNEVLDQYADDENDIVYFKVTSVDSDTLEPATRINIS
jgi:glycosyltransferase involved in cell wall biosynthesis